MPVPQELLDILVCPLCKVPVKLTWICPKCKLPVKPAADNQALECNRCGSTYPAQDGVPETLADSQGLKCAQCRRVYTIKGEVPVMMIDEAPMDTE